MAKRLLIITQKVNKDDPVLGFFHEWIRGLAHTFEVVNVVCLEKGDYDLPSNVKVFSLGKEKTASRFLYLIHFFSFLWRERNNYDSVFVHMNPIYAVLGFPFWFFGKKKVVLWYVHKHVNFILWLAEKCVDTVLTASKESFRLKSKKVKVVGHGIDTNHFKPSNTIIPRSPFHIVMVGRISPVKNVQLLLETASLLKSRLFSFHIDIIGEPLLESDKNYFEALQKYQKDHALETQVSFVGPVSQTKLPLFFQKANSAINLSDTGSIDKTVLEALSCGIFVLTTNEAFREILPKQFLTSKDPREIADRIIHLADIPNDDSLREYVVKNHNLSLLLKKITDELC